MDQLKIYIYGKLRKREKNGEKLKKGEKINKSLNEIVIKSNKRNSKANQKSLKIKKKSKIKIE